jgi:hypothetical protein
MNTTRLRQARRNFVHPMAPRHVQRSNMRAWVRMIRILGDKWQYVRHVGRQT